MQTCLYLSCDPESFYLLSPSLKGQEQSRNRIGGADFAGHAGSSGSYEYLVYRSVLEAVANQHGFESITDYGDPKLDQLFQTVRISLTYCYPEYMWASCPGLSEALSDLSCSRFWATLMLLKALEQHPGLHAAPISLQQHDLRTAETKKGYSETGRFSLPTVM